MAPLLVSDPIEPLVAMPVLPPLMAPLLVSDPIEPPFWIPAMAPLMAPPMALVSAAIVPVLLLLMASRIVPLLFNALIEPLLVSVPMMALALLTMSPMEPPMGVVSTVIVPVLLSVLLLVVPLLMPLMAPVVVNAPIEPLVVMPV